MALFPDYLTLQTRRGDLEEFFRHENQSFPPSLSGKGNLRQAKSKSDVIDSILQTPHAEISECTPVEMKIFDGPALINMLSPSNCKTFLDYSCEVFVPYIGSQSRLVARVYLVRDRYFDDSLKGTTRSNRGVGICQKVTANGFLPKNWMSFLRYNGNKTELFPFLSQNVVSTVSRETLCIATIDENVIANQDVNLSGLMPSTLEEADERMSLNALRASENYRPILIKTVDSDVVTIAISVFHKSPMLNELWIKFGTGKYLKFIPVHEIAVKMGKFTSQEFCSSMPSADATPYLHFPEKEKNRSWKPESYFLHLHHICEGWNGFRSIRNKGWNGFRSIRNT